MAQLNFGGTVENVVTREEFSLEKARRILRDETVAVIGYGVQGPGQALNQRDNGIRVIVGQRKNTKSWHKAVADGFVPGESLFGIEEALQQGTIICYLLSDAAQIQLWPTVKKHLTPGKALYSCMLNKIGGVVDDLIVYFREENFFRVVVNAGTREKDLAWIEEAAKAFVEKREPNWRCR